MRHILIVYLCLTALIANTQTFQSLTYNPDQADLEENPLKGLTPLYNEDNGFPHSIRGSIISLDSIMEGIDDFNWHIFDDFIEEQAEQGRFSYLQVNIDMGKAHVDLPEFLQNDVEHFKYQGGTNPGDNGVSSLVVNYNNETLMLALENFIQRFGERYNPNPRVFLVHYGLYGIFGEWDLGFGKNFISQNTNGMMDAEDWEMSPANQLRITSSYEAVFSNINLLARFPENVPESQSVGYSDGLYFGASISDDPSHFWFFHPKLILNNADENWKNHPIGGEVDPHVQPTLWEQFPNVVFGDCDLVGSPAPPQSTEDIFNLTHPTFIFQDWMFNGFSEADKPEIWANGIKATKMMGYTFHVNEYRLSAEDGKPAVEVNIQNKGIAPMYANWDVEFAYINANGNVESLGTASDWNLKVIQPDVEDNYRSFISDVAVPDGTHTFLLRIINPLEDIIQDPTKAKPVRFANSTQDEDELGWLTLGQASITGGDLGTIPIKVSNMFVIPSSAVLGLQDQIQLTAQVFSGIATNREVTWSSNRPKTASVDENGLVSTYNLSGEVEISAYTQDGGILSVATISVEPFWSLPTLVEAEGYTDAFNVGLVDAEGGQALGFLSSDSWMDYTVKVENQASYVMDFRASAPFGLFGNATLDIMKDGNVLESISFSPSTPIPLNDNCENNDNAAYNVYGTYRSEAVTLPAGTYVIRLDVDQSAFNLNWIDFKLDPCENFDPTLEGTACDDGDANTEVDTYVQCECIGIPIDTFTILPEPGQSPATVRIEAENYYRGFNARRDIKAPAAEGCTKVLTNMDNSSWMEYPVYVDQGASYILNLRGSKDFGDGIIDILNEDGDVLTTVTLSPATGDFDVYADYESTAFTLAAGYHNIRLDIIDNPYNLNFIEFKIDPNSALPKDPNPIHTIAGGDIDIETIGYGVIMKSPDGQCWRYAPNSGGALVGTSVSCPN